MTSEKSTVSQININASTKKCIIFIRSLEKRKDRNVIEVFGYRSENISWRKKNSIFVYAITGNRTLCIAMLTYSSSVW